MKKFTIAFFTLLACLSIKTFAQIPTNTLVQIIKAEDELRFDAGLEKLMKNADAKIRERAALAAGRTDDEDAVPALVNLLENDKNAEVRAMAAFALGEIESIKAADAIFKILKNYENADAVRARAVEAAGKIAAANAKDEKAKALGEAILDTLEFEDRRGANQSKQVVLLGLTAVLRARPEEGDFVTAKYLTNLDARVRADAANTLARIRAKSANEKLRAMLLSDNSPIARANAARALGAAEDKESFDLLLTAATTDDDLRVRVSAIRSLGALKENRAAGKLLGRGEKLIAGYKKSKFANPSEKNELLEIATALGRILPNTKDEKAVEFLQEFRELDKYSSPETEIAFAAIAPEKFMDAKILEPYNQRQASSFMQGMGEIANLPEAEETKRVRERAANLLLDFIQKDKTSNYAISDALNAYAKFKTADLDQVLREKLNHKDVFIRASAASLLGERTAAGDNIEALKKVFAESLKTDKTYDDAQLAALSALAKLNKQQAVESLKLALDAPNFLVRRHAANLIRQNELQKDLPNFKQKAGTVKAYDAKNGTKLGQSLNSNADYTRAVSRRNERTRAVLTTEKGSFTIDLLPEDAPLTVDNFIKLARSGYFNGIAVHRVVPNFVIQDGDPRGDGNGGPGWSIRDEMNTVPYERGAVGMALSGPHTGGSQWFVTHSPQPHLDGGYTVFGRVNEKDMKVVDMIVRGDKILKVQIIEEKPQPKNPGRKPAR